MSPRQILVIGATGRIGGLVARELGVRGLRPRVLVRDRARGRDALGPGVEIVVADLDDPSSLEPAVEGVDALLVVSPVDPRQRELQGNLARCAAAAGRPLVVKISGLGTALDSFVDSGRWHAETEHDIRGFGLPFVFLRPLFLMQNLAVPFEQARGDGRLRGPTAKDARIAMVDARDVAAVAARLLTGEVDRRGETLDLTGPEALTYPQVALRMGAALGCDVAYEETLREDARQQLEKVGVPDWRIEILFQFDRAFSEGWASSTSPAVEQVLGRAPRSLDRFFEDRLAATG